jgi:hypothetical protein
VLARRKVTSSGGETESLLVCINTASPLQVSKGPRDVIAGGTNPNAPVIVCQHDSSLKRCGGLGDVLTGRRDSEGPPSCRLQL